MRATLIRFLKARGLLPHSTADITAVLEAILRFLGSSDAEMVLVNLEDLWLECEPQNIPGVPERSWRRRMRQPLEEARSDATVMQLLRVTDVSRRMGNGNEKQKVSRQENVNRPDEREAIRN